jgi:hypothetical protein
LNERLMLLEKLAAAAAGATKLLRPTVTRPNMTITEQSRWRACARTQFMDSERGIRW